MRLVWAHQIKLKKHNIIQMTLFIGHRQRFSVLLVLLGTSSVLLFSLGIFDIQGPLFSILFAKIAIARAVAANCFETAYIVSHYGEYLRKCSKIYL